MKTKYNIAAVVLVGGLSRRMGMPKDSVVIPNDGRTFLDKICEEVDITYPDVIKGRYLSVRSDRILAREGYESVIDIFERVGPLGGIHASLVRAREDGYDAVLVLACDMTEYDHKEIEAICAAYAGEDILFARTGKIDVQPLASIYSVTVIGGIIEQIKKKEYRIRDLSGTLSNISYYDSNRRSIYRNQNTPFT